MKCPNCGGTLVRVKRRLIDRVLHLFKPTKRFRCEWLGCGWEGTLTGKTFNRHHANPTEPVR